METISDLWGYINDLHRQWDNGDISEAEAGKKAAVACLDFTRYHVRIVADGDMPVAYERTLATAPTVEAATRIAARCRGPFGVAVIDSHNGREVWWK